MSSPYCGWDKNSDKDSDGSNYDFLQINNANEWNKDETSDSDTIISKKLQNNRPVS